MDRMSNIRGDSADWKRLLALKQLCGYLRSTDWKSPVRSSGAVANIAIEIAMALEATEHASAPENPVTAIDIALEPDQTMVGHAEAANAALLQNFPKGFALDDTHHPHVSIFAGFVPTGDLPKVYDAASKVLTKEKCTTWKLTVLAWQGFWMQCLPRRSPPSPSRPCQPRSISSAITAPRETG
jgi:hypothetical protein